MLISNHFLNEKSCFYARFFWEEFLDSSSEKNNIDIVINLGDVSDNSQQEQFDSYKEWSDRVFESKPVINVVGNHDNRNGGIQRFLNTVAGTDSTYYCFTLSDIHLISMPLTQMTRNETIYYLISQNMVLIYF